MPRPRLIICALVGFSLLGWAIWAVRVLVYPNSDPISTTDATYVLASPGGTRGLELGVATPERNGVLVISRTVPATHHALCDATSVVCVEPHPWTTQGEAQVFAETAQKHGWESVTVVTQTSHVSRARLLMERCFPGTVRVIAVDAPVFPQYGVLDRPLQIVYETGAWLKALVTPGCYDEL